jgi:endonuclease I
MSRYPFTTLLLLIFLVGCGASLRAIQVQPAACHKAAADSSAGIHLSVSGLPDFREVYPGHYSDVQWYDLHATDIDQELHVSATGPFRISLQCHEGFDQSLVLSSDQGQLEETRVYVRFFPAETGQKTGHITHWSDSTDSIPLVVSGTGIPDLVPAGYYDGATGHGEELKTRVYEIIREHTEQSYASIWQHFEETDIRYDGHVWDMYSDVPCGEAPYLYTFFEDQDRGLGGQSEGEVYNREHSMPRSWFGGTVPPMNTDLHHIFPADKRVNAMRDNDPFGMVDQPSWTSMNGGKTGQNSLPGYDGIAFEPIDEYKGDLARAFLYMVTRYEDQVAAWDFSAEGRAMLAPNSYPAYREWAIGMLLEWHADDPVSQKEILRNHAVYTIQGNRNPFIDRPELAGEIWGETGVGIQDPESMFHIRVYPNPVEGLLRFESPTEVRLLELYSLCGNLVYSTRPLRASSTVNLPALPAGIYLLRLLGREQHFQKKIVINP